MYTVSKTVAPATKTLSLSGEIYRVLPAELQSIPDECESKIISMSGITEPQFRTAINAIFPDWTLWAVWENCSDELI